MHLLVTAIVRNGFPRDRGPRHDVQLAYSDGIQDECRDRVRDPSKYSKPTKTWRPSTVDKNSPQTLC
jgi:hypothetical protein